MLKILARSVREYKRTAILSPLFVTMEVVCEVLIPLLMTDLIDKGVEVGDTRVIWSYGVLLVALAFVALIFGVLSGKTSATASAGFAQNLRHDMFHRVQDFSFANIDKFSTGGIVTRLTTDVTNLQHSFMMIIRVAVRSPMMLLFSLTMATTIHPRLAGIFALSVPVLAGGLYLIIRYVYPIYERVFQTYDRLNNVVQENLRGIRVVKSFTRERHEEEKFNQVADTIYRDYTKAEKILVLNSPLMLFCVYGCTLLIAWFGAKFIVSGDLSTGDLMGLFTYTMQIMISLMMLSMVFVMLVMSRASARRICEVMTEVSSLPLAENGRETVESGAVEFRNVSFSYADDPEKLCLRDISFSVAAGQTVGIIGGTGSGKSSLVQLIPRLYEATCGQVLVDGVDVREYDLTALRNRVAMVLQKNVLFSGTVRDNLRWGDQDATDAEMEEACRLAEAHDFICAFPDGYDTWIEQGGANVSGGQRQRLAIARALMKKPAILILDDSTSAVDMGTEAAIREAFRQKLPGVTKFIIAQRISSVQDADLILVMDGGRIQAMGDHNTLLRENDIYREVYESQQKGGDLDA